ncbi:MAG: hypothetical protein M3Y70_01245 [Pseudomonadota bacterium]|nr:hypothetical protein [Pseudomonadota bacterium]
MKFATTKILAAALLLAAGTQAAFAAGPTSSTNKAGETISNTATVTFSVGGVVQSTTPDDQADFTVDRLVNVTVQAGATTNVTPGQSAAALTFTVTNNTNSPMDFDLDAANVAAGDDFDAGAFTYYLDDGVGTGGDGVYGTGGDTLVTYLDEMPSDAVWTVFVVANIPDSGQANSDNADVTLLATAHDAGGAAALGALTLNDDGSANADDGTNNDAANVDNVFNDADGDVDGLRDGAHSDTNSYVVSSASITVTKSSAVVSDPINNSTNPKAIPGATMVYCIAVSNGSASVAATDVTVGDPIPTGTTYVPGSLRVLNAGVTCDVGAIDDGDAMTDSDAEDGTPGNQEAGILVTPVTTHGDFGGTTAGSVTTVTSLPVSSTTTTIFQVTID